jgi:hypothetical protein
MNQDGSIITDYIVSYQAGYSFGSGFSIAV